MALQLSHSDRLMSPVMLVFGPCCFSDLSLVTFHLTYFSPAALASLLSSDLQRLPCQGVCAGLPGMFFPGIYVAYSLIVTSLSQGVSSRDTLSHFSSELAAHLPASFSCYSTYYTIKHSLYFNCGLCPTTEMLASYE